MPADAAICSQNVTVEEVAPTISCPANKDATVNSSVTVAPTNLTGCSSGCSYTIEGSSATGNGYTGGNVSFNGEASTGSRNYTFRVSNSKGSASCNFSINYVNAPASSSSGGGYDCRESWGSKPSNVSTACRINGGNCYKCNPERGGDCGNGWLWTGGFDPSWVSYWFVEIPCSGGGGGETPSSSSETPASSSAGGGGGATIQLEFNHAYTEGTYNITSCNGKTGSNIPLQIGNANMQNCFSVINTSTSIGYWNNSAYGCNGQANISLPAVMTIPAGVTISFQGGCW